MQYIIHQGDCLEVLRTLEDSSVDSIVTDPPYGLSQQPNMAEVLRHWLRGDDYHHKSKGFMGKSWDSFVPGPSVWRECLRVLKPGGHVLCFAGTRTQDLMALSLRLAGFEIRDCVAWVYGSGFPKSLDISKAIDKMAGAEREVGKPGPYSSRRPVDGTGSVMGDGIRKASTAFITTPATEAAKQWHGFGTALKPAFEPITLARKPLDGTVAENVLRWGTGGVNVDGARVGTDGGTTRSEQAPYAESGWRTGHKVEALNAGRWPANFIHDGSDEVVGMFPVTSSGAGGQPQSASRSGNSGLTGLNASGTKIGHSDTGSAARFFYCAKASKADRNSGGITNIHATVKPTALMIYLCRLITPPGGTILDPFAGSGSTGKAAVLEGFRFVGIEREPEYVEIAEARIAHAAKQAGQPVPRRPAAKPRKKVEAQCLLPLFAEGGG